MNLSRLIYKEITYRKINFCLSVLVVIIALFSVSGTLALLRAYDKQTEDLLSGMEEKSHATMKKLEDDIRKSTKGLGFNIHIFPKDQNLSEVYSEGYASKTMPESYATTLAESQIVTVNHLLPSLTRKLTWPEKQRTVIVIGVRGEVPIKHRGLKAPLIDPVAKGTLVMGYELHNSLDIKEGGSITFMEQSYTVAKVHPPRGNADDITIWMNLGELQALLNLEGQINSILALECNCSTIDRLGEIRKELLEILPDTQIIETQSTAMSRAESRNQAKAAAKQAAADKRAERIALKAQRAELSAMLIPLIALVGMGVIMLLTVVNVRGRITEIGILRAIGLSSLNLLTAFVARALIVGTLGAILGVGIAMVLAAAMQDTHLQGLAFADVWTPKELVIIIISTPVLCCIAAWIPSLLASLKDPAQVLRHD